MDLRHAIRVEAGIITGLPSPPTVPYCAARHFPKLSRRHTTARRLLVVSPMPNASYYALPGKVELLCVASIASMGVS